MSEADEKMPTFLVENDGVNPPIVPVLEDEGCAEDGVNKCPACGSPDPNLHPATQAEGEVMSLCEHEFHGVAPNQESLDEELVQELDPEVELLLQKARSIAGQNKQLLEWLNARATTPLSGIGESRHEAFFEFLTEIGMIPPKVRALFEVRWAQQFNDSLLALKRQTEAMIEEQKSNQIRESLLIGVPKAAQMPRRTHGKPGGKF